MSELGSNAIGSVLLTLIRGEMSPVPMSIVTECGKSFLGMEFYEGSGEIREGADGDIAEIIFLAMGLDGDRGYFRWLKFGETAQFQSPVKYYKILDIARMNIGYKPPGF
ncbi:MAG TPA: hypothetical protein DEA43_01425 [Candidatus Moranbacteria bacterium]|nr:hypothetical protein [Candidatus Moranbacteria bacterium]HBT45529.1 hypothetical protein [Candidatus Moranbacteria bacterium]